jgi:hypothetical protein
MQWACTLVYCHLWPVRLYYIVICGLSCSVILSSVACPALLYWHLWPVLLYYIVICCLSCSIILSSVACPALLYCHLWPVRLYYIFFTLSHKRHDFPENIFEHKMCVLLSSVTFVWNISHSEKKWERDMITTVCWSSRKAPVIPARFQWNLYFLGRFSENPQNIKSHENPSSRGRVALCGQTDRQTHDEFNSRIARFCERA